MKHGTCTPKVLHIMGHSVMVLVMAYYVKGSKSGFYGRSQFIATTSLNTACHLQLLNFTRLKKKKKNNSLLLCSNLLNSITDIRILSHT